MKNCIIIGASSGIGRKLAKLFVQDEYHVGITGRRSNLLEELKDHWPDNITINAFDVTEDDSIVHLEEMVKLLGDVDLIIYSSGNGEPNEPLDFTIEKETIDLNVTAFTQIADWSFNYFRKKGKGHFVAISSIAGIRGARFAPAYNASKAYQINYLEGLRQKANKLKLPIRITDIRPGFVDTQMAKGDGKFWVAPVEKASLQIFNAIKKRKNIVYITKRWRLIAILLRILPGWLYTRM
ncbi:SDR family NAD(P)-dependent oxidoreductase [Fulvivirgaceae bacterium BMA10]|uniref:SDR family NAD(P)-dependent oxidoreductase n=1 Tax=Splendidivirga corallicola TaxID=3051826 RepID=A0ABT8KNR0_9BACT|nr:SDR family NAD(P)-dependent oxidoreductase [Fulvivirgaceae bacterium BMA10]